MGTVQFKLPIGAKRQVTIPSKAMELLSLQQGDDLLLEIAGDRAILMPAVSVPRHELPEALRKKILARLGAKPTDIPLEKFLEEVERKREETKEQVSHGHVRSGAIRKKGRRATVLADAEPASAKA